VEARGSAPKQSAPPSLVFDHNTDAGPVLWQRLHEWSRGGAGMRLIVHLKGGTTYVGDLVDFDLTRLTISARDKQHHEFWVEDLSYVLAVAAGSAALPSVSG